MVGKLFRHECMALGRVLPLVQGILLVIALFTRILQFFETDHFAYGIFLTLAIVFLVIANVANLVAPLIMGVTRYYKNLFTAEGYLSFTLPITPAQHILTKLSATLVFQIAAVCTSLLSVVIATAGEVLGEIGLAAQYLFGHLNTLAEGHTALFVIELIMLSMVVFLSQLLLYYGCISIGQLSRKNRVLAAVGVYFAYYVIMQIISTVFTVVVSMFGSETDIVDYSVTSHEVIAAIHIALCGMIVWTLIVSAVYFLVSHTIIRKKLNLE